MTSLTSEPLKLTYSCLKPQFAPDVCIKECKACIYKEEIVPIKKLQVLRMTYIQESQGTACGLRAETKI